MTERKQPESNGLAVASMVLGILSLTGFTVFTGIPAIITGAIGLKNPVNKGMSLAGIIMGAVSVLLGFLFFLLIIILILAGAFSSAPNRQGNYDYGAPPSSNTSLRQHI